MFSYVSFMDTQKCKHLEEEPIVNKYELRPFSGEDILKRRHMHLLLLTFINYNLPNFLKLHILLCQFFFASGHGLLSRGICLSLAPAHR